RDAPAIRFKNPALTFDLVDPWYPGDATCRNDRGGTLDGVPTVHDGFALQIPIVNGDFQFGFLGRRNPTTGSVLPIKQLRGAEVLRHDATGKPLTQVSVWVVDEGDLVPTPEDTRSLRGRVFKIETSSTSVVDTIY